MGITYTSRYSIDGVIDTKQDILRNLETIANAAGTWITYDYNQGKFAVVINKAGTSQYSFDDTNIIGPINVSVTALDKLYNTVKVSYPHEDLKGETDWIQIAVPPADRNPNEFENILELDYRVVMDPVQAQELAFIEMKQSRVDKVVQFKTDYSHLGIKAGDLIDITNDVYGWTTKMFRVITVSESDSDDVIDISITALEYDPNVYDNDLSRYIRTDSNGITTLNSLPAPTKPIVTKFEEVSRPHVTITTQITGGLVDSVDFWYSTDVAQADDQREYALLKTASNATQNFSGNTMPLNTNITIDVDSLSTTQFVVKCRSRNSDGVGLWSLPSDTQSFNSLQVTDAIGANTLTKDPDGPGWLSMALPLMLKGLQKSQSNDPAYYESSILPIGYMISVTSGQQNFPDIAINSGLTAIGQLTFTAPYTGTYIGHFICDQNYSGAQGAITDIVSVAVQVTDTLTGEEILSESSGGTGTRYWNDWVLALKANLVRGRNYTMTLFARNSTSAPADITFNWNLYTCYS